nr:unnamed protein product [Spirometra erinaceieuropaei]
MQSTILMNATETSTNLPTPSTWDSGEHDFTNIVSTEISSRDNTTEKTSIGIVEPDEPPPTTPSSSKENNATFSSSDPTLSYGKNFYKFNQRKSL